MSCDRLLRRQSLLKLQNCQPCFAPFFDEEPKAECEAKENTNRFKI